VRGRWGADAAWSGTEIGSETPKVELGSSDVLVATAGGVVGSEVDVGAGAEVASRWLEDSWRSSRSIAISSGALSLGTSATRSFIALRICLDSFLLSFERLLRSILPLFFDLMWRRRGEAVEVEVGREECSTKGFEPVGRVVLAAVEASALGGIAEDDKNKSSLLLLSEGEARAAEADADSTRVRLWALARASLPLG